MDATANESSSNHITVTDLARALAGTILTLAAGVLMVVELIAVAG